PRYLFLFPYTTLFRSRLVLWGGMGSILLLFSISISLSIGTADLPLLHVWKILLNELPIARDLFVADWETSTEKIILHVRLPRVRSEEHTSELQSRFDL